MQDYEYTLEIYLKMIWNDQICSMCDGYGIILNNKSCINILEYETCVMCLQREELMSCKQ